MIHKSQVFTPSLIVTQMLDSVEYKRNLYGKKVLENSFGDGNILVEIVKRYIMDCLRRKISKQQIRFGLEQDIVGYEIDKKHYIKCKQRLDTIASSFGIRNVKWNIQNKDFLTISIKSKFDFIIGNPPYINYREIPEDVRTLLRKKFISCSIGKFDYCYPFIELSINSLSSIGKLAYLIPNSIFKNVFGIKLRKIILPVVTEVIDYTSNRLFKNAITSSTILICDKKNKSKSIKYSDIVGKKEIEVIKASLKDKWAFISYAPSKYEKRFCDYFHPSISIATLLNEAYVLKEYTEDENYVYVKGGKIEKDTVRNGVSPRNLASGNRELIIFPYKYVEDKLVRYSEKEFEAKYPFATKYLYSYYDRLTQRDYDKSISWFEYGRTQALTHLNQPKIVLSTVVTDKVKATIVNSDDIPYSGIFIISKNQSSLLLAKEILESKEFYEYVQGIGINANGSSKRITVNDIKSFKIASFD